MLIVDTFLFSRQRPYSSFRSRDSEDLISSLDARHKAFIDGNSNVLLRPLGSVRGLDPRVTEQELDSFQIPGLAAELRPRDVFT
jgi:hypothetical protein